MGLLTALFQAFQIVSRFGLKLNVRFVQNVQMAPPVHVFFEIAAGVAKGFEALLDRRQHNPHVLAVVVDVERIVHLLDQLLKMLLLQM